MTGCEAIVDKIIDDAKAVVNSTLEEANATSNKALDLAKEDAKIYLDKNMAESYVERDDIVKRKITVANLEVKKILLLAKQKLIDKAFLKAEKEIKADKETYLQYIHGLLKFAEEGDIVTLASSDKGIVSKDFVLNAAKEYGVNIKISDKYGVFCGGIILSGAGSDKNLSLEVELASIKDELEPEIAKILFGE